MNGSRRTQRVKVTVSPNSKYPERVFAEIENTLLGIDVEKVESAFSRIYKCEYSVNLENIIDKALDGVSPRGAGYWTRSIPEEKAVESFKPSFLAYLG